MSERVKQQLHFVAFLDILGYKDFFKEKEHDVERFLETIDEALTTTIENTNQQYRKVPDIYKPQIKMFSDNILIAIRCSNNNENDFLPYLNLVRTVAHIQKIFITKYQLFLRGGIAKGMFYFGEEYVFGEALIKAYEMEQNAIYPKIKIDEKYVDKIIKHIRVKAIGYDTLASILVDVVGKERDGSYFVSYLPTYPLAKDGYENFKINCVFSDAISHPGISQSDKTYETVQAHKKALLGKIRKYGSYDDLFSQGDIENRRKVIIKYMWSLDYHNQVCKVLRLKEQRIHCVVKTDSRTLQPVVEVFKNNAV
jgi:hypothetical protein